MTLNIKNTKLMTTGRITSCRNVNKDSKVVNSLCLVVLTISNIGISSQEMHCRPVSDKSIMKILKSLLKCCDVSILTKIRIMKTVVT